MIITITMMMINIDQLGEEFDETTPDGRQTRALINVEGKSTDDDDHHHHGHHHGVGRLDRHYGETMRCQ